MNLPRLRENPSTTKLNDLRKTRISTTPVPGTLPIRNTPRGSSTFRQWGDPPPPPPPPPARSRTCERVQSVTVKKRPGSVDPRFRRRIEKSNSNLMVENGTTQLVSGDTKLISKTPNVSPRKIDGDGETCINVPPISINDLALVQAMKPLTDLVESSKPADDVKEIKTIGDIVHSTSESTVNNQMGEQVSSVDFLFNIPPTDTLDKSIKAEYLEKTPAKSNSTRTCANKASQTYISHIAQPTRITAEAIQQNSIHDNNLIETNKESVGTASARETKPTSVRHDVDALLKEDIQERNNLVGGKYAIGDLFLVSCTLVIVILTIWFLVHPLLFPTIYFIYKYIFPEPDPTLFDYTIFTGQYLMRTCNSIGHVLYRALSFPVRGRGH